MSIDEQLAAAARRHRGHFDRRVIPDLLDSPIRVRRRRPVAIASVAAACVVVAAVAVATAHSPHRIEVKASTRPLSSSSTPKAPAVPVVRDADVASGPMLWPAFTPPGEQLWSATSKQDGGIGLPSQLFGTVSSDGTLAPGMLLEFQPNPDGGTVNSTTMARVRGVDAAVEPPKDAAGADLEIRWVEGDAEVTAIFRGVGQSQAIAALDALRPRSTHLLDGFDPASAPTGFAALGERMGADAQPTGVEAVFEYAPGPPATDRSTDLEVTTQTRSIYPGYFRTWIGGRRGADGVVVEPDAYDVYHLVTLTWPDGRSVMVQSTRSDTSLLEQIGRSVESVTSGEAQTRLQSLRAQFTALRLAGSVSLGSAHVDLRMDGARKVLCATVGTATPVCRSSGALLAASDSVVGSILVDGRWFVYAAAPGYTPTFGPPGEKGATFPAEVATIGTWHVALAQVPAAVTTVQGWIPTSLNQFSGVSFTRPPASG